MNRADHPADVPGGDELGHFKKTVLAELEMLVVRAEK